MIPTNDDFNPLTEEDLLRQQQDEEFRRRVRDEVRRVQSGEAQEDIERDMAEEREAESVFGNRRNIDTQNSNNQLLVRIDFGILITITATLFSVWYYVSSNVVFGILSGTYFLMGVFLCYKKGQCICKPILDSLKDERTENIAVAFFNSWIHVGAYTILFYYLNFILHPLMLYLIYICVMCYVIDHTKISGPALKEFYKFLFCAIFLTTIITPKPSIQLDKEFYDYNDKIYVVVKNKKVKNWDIIGFVDENGEVIDCEKSTNGAMFKLNASSVQNVKKIFLVYPRRLDIFNHNKILKLGDINKIYNRAKLIELDINVRDA